MFTDEGSVEKLAIVLEGLELGDELGVDSAHTAGHLFSFLRFSVVFVLFCLFCW